MNGSIKDLKIEFRAQARRDVTIHLRSLTVAPGARPTGPACGMAVSLCAVTFVGGQGVAMSCNGVVTPNHPDMAWLIQPPLRPAAVELAPVAPRGPSGHWDGRIPAELASPHETAGTVDGD